MSAPRTKRQFAGASSDPSQRQITSFFSAAPGGTDDPALSSLPPSSQQRPAESILPASVQTNLLSVGMRVRKSVPEGYKTGTYSAFKLWSDADTVPVSAVSPVRLQTNKSNKAAAQRELLPFCGIHSVGGFSSQPSFADDEEDKSGVTYRVDEVPDLDDIPGLTSSQESVESNDSSPPAPGRKRFFDGEEEEDAEHTDGLVAAGLGNARVMAVPRGLARRKAATTTGVAVRPGHGNTSMDDFEDAEFLVGEGMDLSDL